MTRQEALEILELYRDWNEGNVSFSLAFKGIRTPEDDVLDGRRELISKAQRVLLFDKAVSEEGSK